MLQKYGFSYLRGAGTTLLLALVGTFFGCLIGFAVGALQTIPIDKQRDPAWKRVLLRILRVVLRCYVELFRGTPMIVQAVFIYYGLLQVFGIKMGMWTAGFFIVSINTGAYMAETVRGGIVSIDPGQTEGAMAIGMNHWQTMLHVILPQALRNIVPQIGNNFIINIKDTSVLSVISITDLFFVHKSVVGALYTELRPEHHRYPGLHQRHVQRPGPGPQVPESGYERRGIPCLNPSLRCATSPKALAPTWCCAMLTLPSTTAMLPA